MKTTMTVAGVLAVCLAGTGCATKKYVAQQVTPIENRVTSAERKDTDQDKQISDNTKQIQEADQDLSRTKERLTTAETKITAVDTAAREADGLARKAQQSADGAQSLAQQAQQTGQQATQRVTTLARNVDGMVRLKELKSATVLFGFDQRTLDVAAKESLTDLTKQLSGHNRYVLEIQGYADKTGDAIYNQGLSQDRAENVARYLTKECKVPLRNINLIGSGEADDPQNTKDERAQARRVEVRIFVPEVATVAVSQTN